MLPEERRSGPGENRAAKTVAHTVSTKVRPPADRSRQRRRIKVVIESAHCAYVSGFGARDLIAEIRGRAPIWSSMARAWNTTEPTATAVIALAEHRGHEVEVESYVAMRVQR